MSITTVETLSIRKADLQNQRTVGQGPKTIVFAHKDVAGGSFYINLGALVVPPEMTPTGFINPSNPTSIDLAAFHSNLRLWRSSTGQYIKEFLHFNVTSANVIYLNTPASVGEIFVGEIDTQLRSGDIIVDAIPIIATGTIDSPTTDIVVDTLFETGKYISKQLGAVQVIVDDVHLLRNIGNAAAPFGGGGDYEEVPGVGGLCNTIRLNAAPAGPVTYIVRSIEGYAERPTGSMLAVIDTLALRTTALETPTPEYAGGNSGASKTIDWSQGFVQAFTMTANCTFTLTNAVAGQSYTLKLVQDVTGARTYTWAASPGTIKWSWGTTPIGSGSLKTDLISFYYDGSIFYGSAGTNY